MALANPARCSAVQISRVFVPVRKRCAGGAPLGRQKLSKEFILSSELLVEKLVLLHQNCAD
jgi:hypothetical protein